MEDKKYHKYSGTNSKEFWNRVNALSEEHGADKMYCLGVALQNMEGYVLEQLVKSEQEQSQKIKPDSEESGQPPY